MRSRNPTALILALALFGAGPALADSCRRPIQGHGTRAAPSACRDSERLAPYDPGAVKAGRKPGFVDLGNGTEVKVGGSVRFDYDTRRR